MKLKEKSILPIVGIIAIFLGTGAFLPQCGQTGSGGGTDLTQIPTCTQGEFISQTTGGTIFQFDHAVAQMIFLTTAKSLSEISIQLENVTATSVSVEIVRGGVDPNAGTVIATASLSNLQNSLAWHVFPLSAPITVDANVVHWVVIRPNGIINATEDSTDNGFQNGTLWVDHPALGYWIGWGADLAFRLSGCN